MANDDTFARLVGELERGISSNIVDVDVDGKNVVYIAQNKKYRINDTEELVRALAYVSLIIDYGYSPQQIDIEFTVPHRVPNIHADIVVFKDRAKKSPYIVVECKRELASQGELDQAVEQGFGYANSLKADFLWMTSGIRSDYFKVSGFGGVQRVENRIADLPKEGKAEASRAKYTKGGKDGFELEVVEENELTDEVSFVPMDAISDRLGIIEKRCTRVLAENVGYTSFREGDLLWAKITPCMENGKSAVAKGLHNGFGYGSTEYHVLRSPHGTFDMSYLHVLLRMLSVRKAGVRFFTGASGHQRVDADFLRTLELPAPPLDVQKALAAEARARIAKAVQLEEEANVELEQAKADIEAILLGETA